MDNAGNALMEAMIQGVPVIVRADYIDASGAGDLLDHGDTCIKRRRGRQSKSRHFPSTPLRPHPLWMPRASDRIEFVTSADLGYWNKYGRKLATSFLKHVPGDISLRLYHEASKEGVARGAV